MVEYCITGTILSLVDNIAKVKITQNSACEESFKGCNACKGFTGKQEYIIETYNEINVKTGDKVKIKVQSPYYYRALILVFIMPILFLLLGYVFGLLINKIINNAEYYFAMLLFCLSFFLMKILSKKIKTTYKMVGPV